jgi:hypothetical protein
MDFREADESDAPFLADINRQLIEDEWDGGGMSLERLELGWGDLVGRFVRAA